MHQLRSLHSRASMLVIAAALAGLAGGCGGQSSAAVVPAASRIEQGAVAALASGASARRHSSTPVVTLPANPGVSWKQVASVNGVPAAWVARRSGVTLMRFDQQVVHLALHAGTTEPGGGGWAHGAMIDRNEVHRVLAAFNSGFKLNYKRVGFLSGGRVAVPLGAGLGSVVTYQNGSTQIGAWRQGVPARGQTIASVRQNLRLLVDHGVAARTVKNCVVVCWGLTVGNGSSVPRSGLGINAEGELVWAAGEHLSPARLAHALVAAGAQRAVELDINGSWVAGYVYVHHPGGPAAVPVVPGQRGIPGRYLSPYTRDFFTVLAN